MTSLTVSWKLLVYIHHLFPSFWVSQWEPALWCSWCRRSSFRLNVMIISGFSIRFSCSHLLILLISPHFLNNKRFFNLLLLCLLVTFVPGCYLCAHLLLVPHCYLCPFVICYNCFCAPAHFNCFANPSRLVISLPQLLLSSNAKYVLTLICLFELNY